MEVMIQVKLVIPTGVSLKSGTKQLVVTKSLQEQLKRYKLLTQVVKHKIYKIDLGIQEYTWDLEKSKFLCL